MAPEPSVSFSPDGVDVAVPAGATLLEAADEGAVDLEALCGGRGMCGTCTVHVREGGDALSAITSEERTVLDEDQLERGYRLACRAEVTGDVGVFVPDASRSQGGIVLTAGKELAFDLDPAVRQHHLEVPAPTLEDHRADYDRVVEVLREAYGDEVEAADWLALRELPRTLRAEETEEGTYSCTAAVCEGRELLAVRPGRSRDWYGAAVDVGTTTLAVYLVNLHDGETVAVASSLNPQRTHGGDIISRVEHAKDEAGAAELQAAIVDGVNECLAEATAEAGVASEDVLEATFVGNTAMHHLFLGIDPGAVAAAPYVPATHAPVAVKARELGLAIDPSGYATWLPVIGGWVGPDFVADLLAAGLLDREETTACIDIGTNGEIAVFNGERAWVASAPAGPALEGAEIANGMRARPGAIERVAIDPDTLEPRVEVIGDEPPLGLCGSGILDAVAQLFLVGAINRRGRLQDPEAFERIREDADGRREYVLVRAAEAGLDGDVTISQDDIRDIQHAKAAIQTGMRVLLHEAGLEGVDRLVLAGGFGNNIDPASAKLIGMYPEIDADGVEFLGNAAGYGAMYALLDRSARAEAARIVEAVEYVELAAWEGFHEEFMTAMYLPHRDLERYPGVRDALEAVRSVEG